MMHGGFGVHFTAESPPMFTLIVDKIQANPVRIQADAHEKGTG
jgi:hypothetical protein